MKTLMKYYVISGRTVEEQASLLSSKADRKKPRVIRRAGSSSESKIKANERSSVQRLARGIACNFSAGDGFVTLKYDASHYPGSQNAAEKKPEKAEPVPAVQESEPEVVEKAEVENPADGNFYAVQIFAVSKELESGAPQFKGEKNIHSFKVGNVYKYTVGIYKTDREASDAASRLNEKFPGCFVVKIENFEIKKK